jgi:hypothetical protein
MEGQEGPGMPDEVLLRYHLEIDLWIALNPSAMTRVFVLNKRGNLEPKTKDLQDTLGISRAIESNLDHALAAIKKLHTRFEEFSDEWKEQARQCAELASAIMENRFADMGGVNIAEVKELFQEYPVFTGRLLDRWAAIQDMKKDLDAMYSRTQATAYSALVASILRMKTALDQIMQHEDQIKLLLDKYIKEIGDGSVLLESTSARLTSLKDRFFLRIL